MKFVIRAKCLAIQGYNGLGKTGKETNLAEGIKQVEPGVNDNLTCYVDGMRNRLKEGGSLFRIVGAQNIL